MARAPRTRAPAQCAQLGACAGRLLICACDPMACSLHDCRYTHLNIDDWYVDSLDPSPAPAVPWVTAFSPFLFPEGEVYRNLSVGTELGGQPPMWPYSVRRGIVRRAQQVPAREGRGSKTRYLRGGGARGVGGPKTRCQTIRANAPTGAP